MVGLAWALLLIAVFLSWRLPSGHAFDVLLSLVGVAMCVLTEDALGLLIWTALLVHGFRLYWRTY